MNNIIKPRDHRTEIFNFNFASWQVANHLKTLIFVGTAIIIVVEIKYARVSTSNPTVNIWWTQTINSKNPISNIA